ncbi:MAG TPA: hypothetical protein VGK78_06660 [Nocardioides sp.]|uniref:hypothetical protein n=1 Tax=Nocardioides sp. TaxID=35761 RepID=UPI002F4247C4
MSMRGLVVALLCGVLGLGIGVGVAYLASPSVSHSATATPITAVSPSVPIDETPSRSPYAPDITFPRLEPGLPLQGKHVMSNELARWSYHVPLGWRPYWVCSTPSSCPAGAYTDKPMALSAVNKAQEVRFRPPDEPKTGGYSLRVRILDNTFVDVHQTVGTKITGFRDSSQIAEFHILHKDTHSVYFEYRDAPSNLHRFNYFQWFAVPGHTNATLEMSVSGRSVDVPGLKALFNRFADNLLGTVPPAAPPTTQEPSSPSSSSAPSSPPSSASSS